MFASSHIVLTAGSKNPLGLCYAGDVANLQVAAKSTSTAGSGELLCASPWRLVKALADPKAPRHPLRQAAGPKSKAKEEGADIGPPPRVWKWIPYEPGKGEFSVPRDQSEVDAILAACEARQPVPVFGGSGVGGVDSGSSKLSGKQKAEKALKLKDQGGERFLKGDFTGALVAYAAALQTGGFSAMDEGDGDGKQKEASKAPNPNPKASSVSKSSSGQATRTVGEGAAAAAKCHANMAACLLKLGGEERAAKALRAALEASRLDPGYAKAYFRASQALEALGEVAAAAEAKAKADELTAADRARKEKLQAAKKEAKAQRLAAAAEEKENAEAAKLSVKAKEETKEQCSRVEVEEGSSSTPAVAPCSGVGNNTHTIKLTDTSALDASLVKLGIIPSSASMVSPFGGALGSSIGGGGAAPSLSLGGIPIGGSSSSGIGISAMSLSGSTPPQPQLSAIGDGEFTLG